jgi:Transposase IS66 family
VPCGRPTIIALNVVYEATRPFIWALVAPGFVFYKIALTRGAEVLVQLLGEVFAGILCSDRCPTYLKYHKGEGQFCWAHFKRNILGVLEIAKTTEAERFCRDALALHVDELSFFNSRNRRVIEPADYTVFIGGSSIAEQSAGFQTTVIPRLR